MKLLIQLMITCFFTLTANMVGNAQPLVATMNAPQLISDYETVQQTVNTGQTKNFVVRKIPSTFSGYKIQILVSDIALPINHPLFTQFGGITVEVVNERYYYTIGNFDTIDKAECFAKRIFSWNVDEYAIIKYTDGIRKY